MANELNAWLAELELSHLRDLFAEHEIMYSDLSLLNEDDLKEIGLALGPRRRILNAIAGLKTLTEPTMQETSERRQVTVMFADIVGSTELSAKLDPEDLETVILAFHKVCAEVMAAHDGYIAEYLGDGAVIYFGWPMAREDAAAQAGRAALALIKAVDQVHVSDGVKLQVRIGAATGLVVVGERAGPDGAQRAFITGATPNIAARLQGYAKPGGAVIADVTARLAGQALSTRSIGAHSLKGVPEPIEIFEVLEAPDKFGRFMSHNTSTPKPIIGYEEELSRLSAGWRSAIHGGGRAIMLVGEAGIGKSRLVTALTEQIGDAAQQVVLQCSPIRQDTAFWPVACFLAAEAGFDSGDTRKQRTGKLQRLFTGFADEPDVAAALAARAIGVADPTVPWPYDWTPQRERARLMSSLEIAINRMSSEKPMLLLVEDAHWIDPTTLEFIRSLVETATMRRAVILITSRPDAAPDLPDAVRMNLTGLSAARVRKLITMSGGDNLPESKVEEIVTRADGVPLFVEELTRTVVEVGDGEVPASLKDTLMARLDQDRSAKQVAQIAAGLGRVFPADIVGRALGWNNSRVAEALGKLALAGVILSTSTGGATFAFKHALVRDVAYETVLKSERSQLHQRIFNALVGEGEAAAASQPEIMAFHAGEAGLTEASVAYWRQAADLAIRRSAHLEALGHYRKALAQLMRSPDDELRARTELDLQLAIGVTAIQPKSHGSLEVRAAFSQAAKLSHRVGDAALRFRALRGLWHWHSVNGDFDEAARRAKELVTLAGGSGATARLMAHRIMG